MSGNVRPVVGIGVAAKAPVAGHSKTRLCPPLTPSQAARLSEALLLDTLQIVERAPDVRRFLFATTEHDGVRVLSSLAPQWPVVEQASGNLGARIRFALRHMLTSGCDVAMLLGSDAPLVPLADAVAAATWLGQRDAPARALWGPSHDGGYYLVGVNRDLPSLFENVPWSTDAVMAVSRTRARDGGIESRELSAAGDVDDHASLLQLAQRLQQEQSPRHTRALLAAPEFRDALGEDLWTGIHKGTA